MYTHSNAQPRERSNAASAYACWCCRHSVSPPFDLISAGAKGGAGRA